MAPLSTSPLSSLVASFPPHLQLATPIPSREEDAPQLPDVDHQFVLQEGQTLTHTDHVPLPDLVRHEEADLDHTRQDREVHLEGEEVVEIVRDETEHDVEAQVTAATAAGAGAEIEEPEEEGDRASLDIVHYGWDDSEGVGE